MTPRGEVLLLPAGGCPAAMWADPLRDALAAAGFTPRRLDLPAAESFEHLAEAVGAELSRRPGVHVLAAGLGAVAALAAVCAGAPAASLSLLGASPWPADPTLPGPPEEVVAGLMLRNRVDTPHEHAVTILRHARLLHGEGAVFDRAWWRAEAARWVDHGHDVTRPHRRLLLEAPDHAGACAELTAPLLVLHGRADPLLPPEHGRRLAEAAPRARYVELRGVGHWPDGAAQTAIAAEVVSQLAALGA